MDPATQAVKKLRSLLASLRVTSAPEHVRHKCRYGWKEPTYSAWEAKFCIQSSPWGVHDAHSEFLCNPVSLSRFVSRMVTAETWRTSTWMRPRQGIRITVVRLYGNLYPVIRAGFTNSGSFDLRSHIGERGVPLGGADLAATPGCSGERGPMKVRRMAETQPKHQASINVRMRAVKPGGEHCCSGSRATGASACLLGVD